MNLILSSFGLVLTVPDALFGGGCTVVDDHLIITAAFYKEAEVPVMSRKSYYIDLASRLTLDTNSQLEWRELANGRKIPGGFFKESFAPVMYVIGSNTVEPPSLKRRSTDDNPLSEVNINKSNGFSIGLRSSMKENDFTVNEANYLEALNEGLKIAVIYKNKYHLLRNPESQEDPLSEISIDTENQPYSDISLKNTPPPYMSGYSVTLRLNTVYIATDNKIHALDLDSYEWKEHTVDGFKAAQSGCLITHKNTLIHAFGKDGDTYLNRTQFIDMNTWTLKNSLNFDEPSEASSGHETSNGVLSEGQKGPSTVILILIGCVSLLALLVLAGCTIRCIRKHKMRPELAAPEYYTETVWAEPDSTASQYCQLDLSLSNEDLSHDLTPGSSPFSTDSYSNYRHQISQRSHAKQFQS